jgi:hypothetical protein
MNITYNASHLQLVELEHSPSYVRAYTACHLYWHLREPVVKLQKMWNIQSVRMHISSQCNNHVGLPELMVESPF